MKFLAYFCGHGDDWIYNEVIKSNIEKTITKLYEDYHIVNFLSGGMGKFDALCESTVLTLKKKHPEVKLFLIIPYITTSLNKNKEWLQSKYDEIICPDFDKEYHHKQIITERNKWIVNNSDYIVSYVYRSCGGAFKTLKYAKKIDKKIISILDT